MLKNSFIFPHLNAKIILNEFFIKRIDGDENGRVNYEILTVLFINRGDRLAFVIFSGFH
jgi:hypothetical protein